MKNNELNDSTPLRRRALCSAFAYATTAIGFVMYGGEQPLSLRTGLCALAAGLFMGQKVLRDACKTAQLRKDLALSRGQSEHHKHVGDGLEEALARALAEKARLAARNESLQLTLHGHSKSYATGESVRDKPRLN